MKTTKKQEIMVLEDLFVTADHIPTVVMYIDDHPITFEIHQEITGMKKTDIEIQIPEFQYQQPVDLILLHDMRVGIMTGYHFLIHPRIRIIPFIIKDRGVTIVLTRLKTKETTVEVHPKHEILALIHQLTDITIVRNLFETNLHLLRLLIAGDLLTTKTTKEVRGYVDRLLPIIILSMTIIESVLIIIQTAHIIRELQLKKMEREDRS